MFIHVVYKDPPELSTYLRRRSSDTDTAVEKTLIVNPTCHVRVMLEYIRQKCRLAKYTQFDLCDESGGLKCLFNYATYAYVMPIFEHKKVYYLIVLRQETERITTVLPQLIRDNKLYQDLQTKVKRFLLTGDSSPQTTTPGGKGTPTKKK